MKITATELNQKPGTYVEQALKESVLVEKNGRPVVVMVSYEHYLELDEAYWGQRAIESDKDKPLSVDASMQFLTDDD